LESEELRKLRESKALKAVQICSNAEKEARKKEGRI
jgi:hypothetical protein